MKEERKEGGIEEKVGIERQEGVRKEGKKKRGRNRKTKNTNENKGGEVLQTWLLKISYI